MNTTDSAVSKFIKTLISALLLLTAPSAHAWETPQKAIAEFLSFELNGGRLQKWDFEKYLAVNTGYDEPAWDQVTLVASCKGKRFSRTKKTYTMIVTFKLIPTKNIHDRRVASYPKGGIKKMIFKLVRTGNGWRLKPVRHHPFIFEAAYEKSVGT